MIFSSGGGAGNAVFDLLWENASPSSDFSAQSVQIAGLSSYNFLAIETEIGLFFISTNATSTQSMQATKVDGDDLTLYVRRVSVTASSNTLDFRDGYNGNLLYSDNPTQSNNVLIPQHIYGVHKKE